MLEQEVHELLELGHLFPIRPERHDILQVVELAQFVPVFSIFGLRLKAIIQRADLSNSVTSYTL